MWDRKHKIGLFGVLGLFYLFFVTFLLSSCSTKVMEPPLIIDEDNTRPIPREYRIQMEDQLEVKFYYNEDLNEQITVRPDGYISLQLIEDIKAAGLTPFQLTKVLKEKYKDVIANTEITVIVRSFMGQKIYVDGEVN
ncbi:MAG: polysaccharide biosynthesis/export family protein, partial [Desulfobulbaceae bacterium]|nr:polysaccharide biosynthesis/export family protein [Desulfobulbaceae bacterium]